MKKLEYKIDIAAPRKKVWDTMLDEKTYKEWTSVAWPGSLYDGEWKQGKNIRFISKDESGTLAVLEQVRPEEHIHAKHVAILLPGGVEDRTSDIAKGWVGITESYTFKERDGRTEVLVNISTHREWEKMFNEGWPKALAKLKEMCEQ
ncbi:MAG: SRPBCC domain-containing protein [Chryseolinea sp.]